MKSPLRLLLSVLAAVCALSASAAEGERLYNGIELPKVWPPSDMSTTSSEPMPVPYLKDRPKLIPIDVGRQLFVDDFLIESTDLRREFHQPRKYAGNPVFKAETEQELATPEFEIRDKATTFLGHGGVFWDPAENVFKMFYTAGWRGGLALATSKDLVHWERPELGLAGGNLLLRRGVKWVGEHDAPAGSDNAVWLDLNAKNPAERLKFIACWMHVPRGQRPDGFTHSLRTSPDGRVWSDAVPVKPEMEDYSSFFYNPFRQRWVFSMKTGGPRGRSRTYFETTDFMAGSDQSKKVFWTGADRLDQPATTDEYPGAGDVPQLYSLNAVAYESIMIGMHYIHRGPSNEVCVRLKIPKLLDLEMGYSRDGFHWDRPDRRGFIRGSRTEGSWDRAYLHGTTGVFVVMGDKLVFPYMGTSGVAPDGTRGLYTGGSIGLAILRRDGFASMEADPKGGSLTTRPVVFSGTRLFVNVAAATGELRAEVLDENNAVFPGFSAADCLPVKVDSTIQSVGWRNGADLSALRGKPVRFRFHLNSGSLYAFWVSPDESGASRGYVAAGGPGYDSTIDTVGKRAYTAAAALDPFQ
jgi:hypothetical protein